jgi:hypothetical protein
VYEVGRRVRYIGGAPGYADLSTWEDVECAPHAGDVGTVVGYTSPEESFFGDVYTLVRLDNPFRHANSLGECGWRMWDEWLEPIEEE